MEIGVFPWVMLIAGLFLLLLVLNVFAAVALASFLFCLAYIWFPYLKCELGGK